MRTALDGTAAEVSWLPTRLRRARPVVAAALVVVLCYAVLTVAMIGSGVVITHLLSHSVGHWDEQVNAWFARRRTATGNRVTGDFTVLADTLAVIGVAACVIAVTLLRRRARLGWFLAIGLALELVVFLSTTYVVARPRPEVPHVGSTPSTFSWPSGHVAATLVLYGGTALIVSLMTRRLVPRLLAWTGAMVLTACVGLSRIYRGDHHPTDAMAGLVLGAGALCGAFLAVKVWAALARPDTEVHQLSPTPPAPAVSEGVRVG